MYIWNCIYAINYILPIVMLFNFILISHSADAKSKDVIDLCI